MARETKEQLRSRIADDNATARLAEPGWVYESDIFGTTTLLERTDEVANGWEIYKVQHSGFTHRWTSASIVASHFHPKES